MTTHPRTFILARPRAKKCLSLQTYGLKRLMYFEFFDDLRDARQRESNIKHWPRAWKVRLIHQDNPNWDDLYDTACNDFCRSYHSPWPGLARSPTNSPESLENIFGGARAKPAQGES